MPGRAGAGALHPCAPAPALWLEGVVLQTSGSRPSTRMCTVAGMPHIDPEIVRLAETFGDVARALATEDDMGGILDAIVHLAVENLDACEFAGISYVDADEISSPARSADVPRILDDLQSESGEGPSLDAMEHHEVFKRPRPATSSGRPKASSWPARTTSPRSRPSRCSGARRRGRTSGWSRSPGASPAGHRRRADGLAYSAAASTQRSTSSAPSVAMVIGSTCRVPSGQEEWYRATALTE